MVDDLGVKKDPGITYPILDPLMLFNFFININITLPIKSKGINTITNFVILIDKVFSDLPDLLNIKLIIINKLKR